MSDTGRDKARDWAVRGAIFVGGTALLLLLARGLQWLSELQIGYLTR
jgi:hypothetical protein